MKPLISICVPAYKRENYLRRLLDSIAQQTFKDFEVVLTDDSTDDTVGRLIKAYEGLFPVVYVKNSRQLGTPENWNESIRRSQGPWIKLMHDDDWFRTPDALSVFAAAIHPSRNFVFCAYENVYEDGGRTEIVKASATARQLLSHDPVTLLYSNIIGPPSVTLYRRSDLEYDKRMKWKVDVDFYIHYLQESRFSYIAQPLVSVGISREQVTQSCFLVPEVEIPENMLLLQKIGQRKLRNILAYDSWWRLLRNLGIRSVDQIRAAGYPGNVPPEILGMIRDQKPFSGRLLQIGLLSKLLMAGSYIRRGWWRI